MAAKRHVRKPFDKYALYTQSVQDPPTTIEFIERIYRKHNKKRGFSLAEDFCGTFALSCEFVRRNHKSSAVAIDSDIAPLNYGKRHYLSALPEDARARLNVVHRSVMAKHLPMTDVIAAMNFSYFLFKTRAALKAYFSRCFDRLNARGLFVLDCFGGSECVDPNEDVVDYPGYKYYWDQASFDPITHEAMFYIHFKRRGEKRRERVFKYDWRMWTLPELRDLLEEVGFRNIQIYWEAEDPKDPGSSRFRQTTHSKSDPAWLAYITATK